MVKALDYLGATLHCCARQPLPPRIPPACLQFLLLLLLLLQFTVDKRRLLSKMRYGASRCPVGLSLDQSSALLVPARPDATDATTAGAGSSVFVSGKSVPLFAFVDLRQVFDCSPVVLLSGNVKRQGTNNARLSSTFDAVARRTLTKQSVRSLLVAGASLSRPAPRAAPLTHSLVRSLAKRSRHHRNVAVMNDENTAVKLKRAYGKRSNDSGTSQAGAPVYEHLHRGRRSHS